VVEVFHNHKMSFVRYKLYVYYKMHIYQGELLINREHLLYTAYACYNVDYT